MSKVDVFYLMNMGHVFALKYVLIGKYMCVNYHCRQAPPEIMLYMCP